MKLDYNYLLECLGQRYTVLHASGSCDAQYELPAILTGNTEIDPGRTYILSEENVKTLVLHEDVLLLICCNPENAKLNKKDLRKHSLVENNDIYLQVAVEDITSLYEYLIEIFYKENAWQDTLWGLYSNIESATIQDYLNVSASMFEGALAYYPVGEWKTCLYASTGDWRDTRLAGLLDEKGEAYSEEVDYSNFQTVIDSVSPVVMRMTDRFGDELYVLAVSAWESKQYYVGMFVLPIESQQASSADIWHLSKLRDAWEMYLGTRLTVNGSGLLTKYGLLRQLLLTESADNFKVIKKHLKTLGFPPNLNYSCAIVRINSEGAYQKIPLKQYRMVIESMGNGCYALEYKSDIAVILDNKANKVNPENFFSKVLENINPVKAQIGISIAFTDILQLRLFTKQALASLETGLEVRPGECIFSFKDIAIQYILTHGTRELPARLLCAPGLLELQKKSDAGGIDYIDTLRIHLKNSCNASLTSRELSIHRSTLLYRLERINTITKMNLENPDDRFYLELSLAMLK